MKKGPNRARVADDARQDMRTGEKDEDVYDRIGRDALVEDDEISPWERGFMEGAEKGGQKAKCASCGVILARGKTVEKKLAGKLLWFCTDACLKKYQKAR